MLKSMFARLFPENRKLRLKKVYFNVEKYITDAFYSYDIEALEKGILRMGVEKGDTLLVHSSFNYNNGFKGTPNDVVRCLLKVVGEEGNLLMVSLPYRSSSYQYLMENPVFDVKRTVSQMGIISEIFRRKQGVQRSLHPTHPVLAYGKDSEWIVKGHEKSPFPCGEDTPFGKLRALNGKVLFFDVPFSNFTFIHYLEDLIRDRVPIPIYRKQSIPARVKDSSGQEMVVETYVFSEEAVSLRNPGILEEALARKGMLWKSKIGRTRLLLVKARDAVECTEEMLGQKIYFYTHQGSSA